MLRSGIWFAFRYDLLGTFERLHWMIFGMSKVVFNRIVIGAISSWSKSTQVNIIKIFR